MKRMLFLAALGLLLAGCSQSDNTSTSAASTNAGSSTVQLPASTTEPAGPSTGVGASAAASSGVGTATASGSTAVESAVTEDKSIPPAGTGVQDATVNTNGAGHAVPTQPQNGASTR
jgi:hypothetical protein